MANRNGMPWLPDAVDSVLSQSHASMELVVGDDASDDASVEYLERRRISDNRLRIVRLPEPGGPSAARNAAIAASVGDWIAICDSDDLMVPDRLEGLLRHAAASGADMVADDMVHFSASPMRRAATVLGELAIPSNRLIGTGDLLNQDRLGYLKPLIRREIVPRSTYDPALSIGEDYHLYLRLLVDGAKFEIVPGSGYLYRRHAASLSHRSRPDQLRKLASALSEIEVGEDQASLARRVRDLRRAADVEQFAIGVRDQDFGAAFFSLRQSPLACVGWITGQVGHRLSQTFPASIRPPLELSICEGRPVDRNRMIQLPPKEPGRARLAAYLCFEASRRRLTLSPTTDKCETFCRLVPMAKVIPTGQTDQSANSCLVKALNCAASARTP
ncbi:glycosyltransferase family 2 protein [Pelagovum pacificum]|nr:glycosyltransferase family 2 protein [Pelagovum pacificum]